MDLKSITEIAATLKVSAEKLLDKPTKELGEGVGNLFWLAFTPVLLARNYLEPRIEKFKTEIATEISKVPKEQLTEPPLNIVGPALEASKYYIEDEDLRLMFAKLIAASMDTTKQSLAHPSFVEIIKQMSAFDAQNFKFLSEHISSDKVHFGVGRIDQVFENGAKALYHNFIPFPEMRLVNATQYASSLGNLIRLELINLNFDVSYTDSGAYLSLINHPLYKYYEGVYTTEKIKLTKGIWDISAFGQSFKFCCL